MVGVPMQVQGIYITSQTKYATKHCILKHKSHIYVFHAKIDVQRSMHLHSFALIFTYLAYKMHENQQISM